MKNMYPQVSYKIDRIPDTNLFEDYNEEESAAVITKMNYCMPDINLSNFKSTRIADYRVDISKDNKYVTQTVTFDIVEQIDLDILYDIVKNNPSRLFERDLFLRKFNKWLNTEKGYYDVEIARTE